MGRKGGEGEWRRGRGKGGEGGEKVEEEREVETRPCYHNLMLQAISGRVSFKKFCVAISQHGRIA